MKKRSFRPIVLTLCLALLGAQAATVGGTVADRSPQPAETAAVVGAGWKAFLGCVGCIGAGVAIAVSGGWAAILVAAGKAGSTLALGACVGFCYHSVT